MQRIFVLSAFLLFNLCLAIGQTWTSLNGPYYANDARDISVVTHNSTDTVYTIGGANRELLRSVDHGTTWTHLGKTNVYCVAAKPDNATIVLIGLGDNTVWKSTDAGSTWTETISSGLVSRPNRLSFDPNASAGHTSCVYLGLVFGTTTSEHLYRSKDAGSTWSAMTNFNYQSTITDIVFDPITDDTIYVSGAKLVTTTGADSGVWRTTTGYSASLPTFSARITGMGSNKNIGALVLDPSNHLTLYAGSYYFRSNILTFHSTTNGGANWSSNNPPVSPTPSVLDMKMYSSSTILVATTRGIWESTNSGTGWTAVTTSGLLDPYGQSIAISTVGPTTYEYLGTFAAFYKSTDIGVTWTEITKGMTLANVATFSKSQGNIYTASNPGAAANASLINRSTDGGTTWQVLLTSNISEAANGGYQVNNDIQTDPDTINHYGRIILGGQILGYNPGYVILRSSDYGITWTRTLSPTGSGGTIDQIAHNKSHPDTAYAVGSDATGLGRCFRSTDNGITWPLNTNAATTEVKGLALDPISTSTLYIGAVSNGVRKSTDAGSTFTPTLLTAPTVNRLVINPNAPGTIVAIRPDSISRTINSWTNWTSLLNPASVNLKRVMLDPRFISYSNATDYLFAVGTPSVGADSLYRTDNGATSWHNITNTLIAPINDVRPDPRDTLGVYTGVSNGVYRGGMVNAPVLTSPADGSEGYSWCLNITLSWNAPTQGTATSYRVQISQALDPTYTNPVLDTIVSVTTINVVKQTDISCGVRYWRVAAIDAYGVGPWSASRGFYEDAAPYSMTLASPASGSTNQNNCSLTLNWNPPCNATQVTLQVATDSTFSSGMFYNGFPSGFRPSSYTLTGLACNTKYYWRVRGENGCSHFGGDGPWTSVWSFSTWPCGAPPSPSLTAPANGATGMTYCAAITYQWVSVSTATSYRIQVAADAGFTSIIKDSAGITNTSIVLNLSLACNSTYYWHVLSTSCNGTGSYSGAYSFTTLGCGAPSAPTLSSPANNSSGVIYDPLYVAWTGVSNAQSYELQVSPNASFTPPFSVDVHIGGSRTDTSVYGLTCDHDYWWRMSTTNCTGTSAWSTTFKFHSELCQSTHLAGSGLEEVMPTQFSLSQNYPNPFNPTTTFSYALPIDVHVTLKLYNILGQEVATLVNSFETAGYKSVVFDASRLSSGLYFYKLAAGNYISIKKMLLAK